MNQPQCPQRGDIILVNFTPQAGSEQAGNRPALVLSPQSYNERVGLLIACPITGQQKGYPFEVALPAELDTFGVVLSDHVKSLDWRARRARVVEQAPAQVLEQVLSKLALLISADP